MVIEILSTNNTRANSTHGHQQMVNIEIRLIIFFAAEDGEALYSQEKQDQELTVTQIRNSYCEKLFGQPRRKLSVLVSLSSRVKLGRRHFIV